MSHTTRATQFLTQQKVRFTLATYDYDPNAESIGLAAAAAMGAAPSRVLKTLMATVDGKPVCAIVPSDWRYRRCRPSKGKRRDGGGGGFIASEGRRPEQACATA